MPCDFLAGPLGRQVRREGADSYTHFRGDFFCASVAGCELYRLGVAQECEVSGSRRDEPFCCELSAQTVVGTDDTVPLTFLMVPPDDHRQIAICRILNPLKLVGLANHDHPVDHA